jgi:hypothetical protein
VRIPDNGSRLSELERVVDNGHVERGRALREIRDDGLYPKTFATFEKYCKERFLMTPRHAQRLMAFADTVDNLRPTGRKLCTSESVLRPLCGLPPDEQVAVWTEATSAGRTPTAQIVSELVKELRGEPVVEPAAQPGPDRVIALVLDDMERAVQGMNSCMSLAEMERFAELLASRIEWRRRMDARRTAKGTQ